jgi:PAS domain S-box-containing protein
MPRSQSTDGPLAVATAFDIRTMVELSRRGLLERLGFAGAYAAISLLVLPRLEVVGWMSMILVWELVLGPLLERLVIEQPGSRGSALFPIVSLLGSSIYQALAFLCLVNGSILGVAIAATWITGSVLNAFIYSSATRWLLTATLLPAVAAMVVGPWLAYGFGWKTVFIPVLIGLSSLGSRRFSLDHGALLRQLSDRQIAFADVERKLSVAIEASGDGLFENDLRAKEFHVSPAWSTMLGYGPGEVKTPMPEWRVFVHPDDVPKVEQDYLAHFRGETPHTASEQRMLCKDGTYKWVLSRSRLVSRTPDGRPWLVVGTTIDISARKALEEQLEAARDAAEAANSAKSVFIANMSHEIRTPLNGVIGITGALERTSLTPGQHEMVALVQSSGQMLERNLSDILDQTKIEAGNFQLQIAPFDLRKEIAATAELMRASADEKGLTLEVIYSEKAQGIFIGDAVRLRQIVSNLISNAFKFTQAGGVTVKVEAVDGIGDTEPTLVRIDVADTGIGFDAAVAKRLFARFVQADGSISRRFGGTGLGLSICKTLTELMGGQITALSQLGAGSIFTLELPLPRSPSIADGQPPAPDEPIQRRQDGEPEPDVAKIRVLLAEDHPTNQRVVQLILEPAGMDLTIVANGQEAVDIFLPGRFDLILMDMQMPVMDGLAATRAIRDLERDLDCPATPIAMFTANAMDEDLARAREAGANGHISKPITPGRLLAGIELALSQDPSPVAALA